MITYDPLWETMKERGVTQYKLIKKHGVSPAQITRLKRNSNVSSNTIGMLCAILECSVEEVMQYIPD